MNQHTLNLISRTQDVIYPIPNKPNNNRHTKTHTKNQKAKCIVKFCSVVGFENDQNPMKQA